MKIRGRKPSLPCSASLSSPSPSLSPSPSPSPSSSLSSHSSSITAANSSASSQDSSISCPHPSSHRWHGLDLLVKAIHQVTAGSVIGVPYIQRRVTTRRRRRRSLDYDAFVFDKMPKRTSDAKKKTTMKQKVKKGKKESGLEISAGRSDLFAGEMGLGMSFGETMMQRHPSFLIPCLKTMRGEDVYFHHVPVFGFVCGLLGFDADTTQRGRAAYLFVTMRDVISAATRLNVVGPLGAAVLQHQVAPVAENLSTKWMNRGVNDACLDGLPCRTCPLLDNVQGCHA